MKEQDIWNKGGIRWRVGSILDTDHGKALQKLADGIDQYYTVDLGCGNAGAREIFHNYLGLDLPYWDVHNEKDRLIIATGKVVLMNAFLDIMEKPIEVLNQVLPFCEDYVIIHRQEVWDLPTTSEKRKAYGGWMWHSKINKFVLLETFEEHNFKILKHINLSFDNWTNGGDSFLLQRK